MPPTWLEFVTHAKKSLKRKIKKAEARLESGKFEIRSTKEGLDFDEAFRILVELHQDRFRLKGEPGVFSNSRFTGFLNDASKDLNPSDRSEITVIYHEGRPLVAQIYLLHSGRIRLYQMGIRASKMHLEPGHLLLTYRIRQAIQEKALEFDFLRGNQPYKRLWGAEPCQLVKLRMVTNRIFPTTVNRFHQFLRNVKQNFQDQHVPRTDKMMGNI